jgi:uncharacterized protein YndB with AHSA1/START domain
VPEIVERVRVEAPAQRTWDAIMAWDRQSEWVMGTRVYATKFDGRGVGGEVAAFTGLGPIGITDTMVITEWDPPSVCRVRHTGRVVRGTGTFEVAPDGANRSVVTWSEDVIVPLGAFGEAMWPLAKPVIAWGVRRSLRVFARWAPTYPM